MSTNAEHANACSSPDDDGAHGAEVESVSHEGGDRERGGAAYLFSLLTGYVTHMTDEEAQAALPDVFKNVEVVYESAEDRRVPSNAKARDIPDEPAVTTAPVRAMADLTAAASGCGHTHAELSYERGCTYATRMAAAMAAALCGDSVRAGQEVIVADRALWPLADLNDPDSLRDFIAATHAGFESRLRALGVNVPT